MRLLKPQAPTCKGRDLGLGSPTMGPKLDTVGGALQQPHSLTGTLPSPLLPGSSVAHPSPRPGPHLAVEVAQAAVALSGPVELSHLGDVETAGKLGPDGLPEAVAERHAHPVLGFRLPWRLVQEVAAQFADVLYNLGADRPWVWAPRAVLTSYFPAPQAPTHLALSRPPHSPEVIFSLSGPQSPHWNNERQVASTVR